MESRDLSLAEELGFKAGRMVGECGRNLIQFVFERSSTL